MVYYGGRSSLVVVSWRIYKCSHNVIGQYKRVVRISPTISKKGRPLRKDGMRSKNLLSNTMHRVATLVAHLSPKDSILSVHPTTASYEDVKDMSVEQLRTQFGGKREDRLELDGINHIAWVCSDMARTVHFWNECLGLRLTKTLQLPGNGQHFFLEGGRGAAIAYFYFPNAAKQAPGLGTVDMQRLYETGQFDTAHGSVNHVAFNVPLDKLRAFRRQGRWFGNAKIGVVMDRYVWRKMRYLFSNNSIMEL